jgi:hypothetical protein
MRSSFWFPAGVDALGWTTPVRSWVLAILVLLSGLASGPVFGADAGKKAGGKKADKPDPTAELFDNSRVFQIEVEISKEGLESLKKSPRTNILATLKEGGRVYTNVTLHLKGAAGSFRQVDDRPALTMNFDKAAEGQKFHGLTKMSLNNSVQDETYTAEKVSRELFTAAGVPTPRAGHATVKLNGRDLGLYLMVEGWGKQFLKQHFKNTSGNLYDGGFVNDIDGELSVNSGDNPKDQSDLKALVEAAKEPNLTNRLARLEQVLDVDRFLTFLALDVITWNWDGYGMNRNNYRVFHNKSTGKLVFMPHGLDQMFWRPDGPILPPMGGLVAKALIEIPEVRKRYFDRMAELMKTSFKVEALTNRVAQVAALVRPVLVAKDPEAGKSYDEKVAAFNSQIVERGELTKQLVSAPQFALKFDANKTAAVTGWKTNVDFGKPRFAETSTAGQAALEINAPEGSSIGRWQTKVLLESGKYTVKGRVKTIGAIQDSGDKRGGAFLRASGIRSEKKLLGDSEWVEVSSDFEVPEPAAITEIVCEFRGAKGQAVFDKDSLKVVKK